jgi:hypothetical protein
MTAMGRKHEPGIEYECPNCKGIWNYVEKLDFELINPKNGISSEKGMFFPVMPPSILKDIMEQQPNKSQTKKRPNNGLSLNG